MKKLLLLVASAAMIFSCSKDALNDSVSSGTPDDGSGQTRAGYRLVNADLTVTNGTESAIDFQWGVASINFYGDGGSTQSPLISSPASGQLQTASNASGSAVIASNTFMLLSSSLAERIDITFNRLESGLSNCRFNTRAEVYGNNNMHLQTVYGVSQTAIAQGGNAYTLSVSLSGTATQQDGYTIKIFVEVDQYSEITINGQSYSLDYTNSEVLHIDDWPLDFLEEANPNPNSGFWNDYYYTGSLVDIRADNIDPLYVGSTQVSRGPENTGLSHVNTIVMYVPTVYECTDNNVATMSWVDIEGDVGGGTTIDMARWRIDFYNNGAGYPPMFAITPGTYTEADGAYLPIRSNYPLSDDAPVEGTYIYWEFFSKVVIEDTRVFFHLKEPWIGDFRILYRIEAF